MTSTADYIELRARSAFSFLEGATTPEDLATRAAELGYPAIALGDRDGLYGAPRFHMAAKSTGIRAMVGAELTVADDAHGFARPQGGTSKTRGSDRAARSAPVPTARLYVLAPDRASYRNLCRMITESKLRVLNEGAIACDGTPAPPEYPPKGESWITLDDLERYGRGLICLAGGVMSPLARMLVRGDDPRALCDRLGTIFGCGNFYIDLQRHLDAGEERLNRRLAALATSMQIPVAASNDVCHAESDRRLLDVLTCIRLGTTLEEAGRALWVNRERHLKPASAMAELFRDLPGAVAATRAIAERCEFTLGDMGYRFPDYPLPPGETHDSYLRTLTYAGARERWGAKIDGRTRAQLEHELQTIAKLGLAGYFLIVWDIVQFCRENRIMVQGRGSAANSAVCYALGITAVDAVRMELLFERFLSEERGEWPDIDLDLPSGGQREQAIQYVYKRYGERGAAMTANVITYRTKSAVREVGKVLGFAPEQVDRLAKLYRVYEFRDERDDLVTLLKHNGVDVGAPQVRLLADMVPRILSIPRHLGQHSGGMVIAAHRLDDIVALEPASMPGRVVIQWDKEDCADLGIIKIDLLGLGMLAALEQAIPMIRAHEGVEIDLAHLPADDTGVYEMLTRADTAGVFQVESRAQMATLPRMKPRTFYDLVVEVAIIRPGPIVGKLVHPYLNRRNGRERVSYAHPSLEPILKRTLGVPLFQEQLLRIAMTVAGFTGGEAEELRRAMGFKRSMERMEKIDRRLRTGMARNGLSAEVADDIVRSITSFALYGFPESHAASFALIAYASAYLKHHHPAAFFAALLNCYPLGFYHPSTLVKDAQRHGVVVVPVDVTRSAWECILEEYPLPHPLPGQGEGEDTRQLTRSLAIRMGLKYVSGLREDVGLRAERERTRRQFDSIADFAARATPNRRELDALSYAGAFAAFGHTRRDALWNAAAVERDPGSLLAGAQPRSQTSPLPGMTALEETLADYSATGLTVGPQLMAHLREQLRGRGILSAAELNEAKHGSIVKTAGVVIVRQRPGTAKGFLFVTLEDETGISNLIVTPDLFHANRALLQRAPILLAAGPLQKVDGVTAIRARRFAEIKIGAELPQSHDFH